MKAQRFAQWLVDNKDKEGTPDFEKVAAAFKLARETEEKEKAAGLGEPTGVAKTLEPVVRGITGTGDSGFWRGYGDPASGIAQLTEKAYPTRNIPGRQAISESLARNEPVYQAARIVEGDEGVDWDRIAGNIVNPVSLAMMQQRPAATLLGRTGQGSATGAGFSAAQPVMGDDYWSKKAFQAGTGGVVGAIVPSVFYGVGKGVEKIRSHTPGGKIALARKEIAQDLSDLLGESKEKVVEALKNYRTYITKPTSAEAIAQGVRAARAAGIPDEYGGLIATLSRELGKEPGVIGDTLKTYAAKGELGRETLLKSIVDDLGGGGKVSEQILNLEAKRASQAAKNYAAAWGKGVNVDQELSELARNPYFQKAMSTASDLAKAKGVTPKSDLTRFLHFMKVGIDKQLSKTGDDALAGMEKEAAMELKGKVLNWLAKKNPAYEKAREEYAKASAPINQARLTEGLMNVLKNPQEKEMGTAFLRAQREVPASIRRSTGQPRFTKAEQIYEPSQMGRVSRVTEELLNKQKAEQMATGTRSMLNEMLAKETLQLPRILERNIVIMNAILRKAAEGKNPEYKQILGQLLKDPDALREALTAPVGSTANKVATDILRQLSILTSAQGMGREIGE